MPLLGKEEFCLKSLPDKLSSDEQVFYCHITGEAFLSYDEYFERQFLYSSLLWTCSVTGRTGLTYSEALKSEQESKALLSTIPTVLQKVMLHLMTYMNNFSTNVTLSILIEYTNLRYFIGEHVQISPKNKNKRINGIIRDVIPPENYEKSSSIAYGIDPLAYNYLVECVDQPDELDGDECIVIPAARISRSKFLLTREKIRLFLKQHLAPKNGRYEALSIKEESLQKFGVDQLTWEDIFKGPTPNFSDDTLIVKALSRQRHTEECNSHNNDSLNENDENHENENLIQVSKKKSSLLSLQKQKLIRRGAKLGNANNNSSKKSKKDNKLKRQSLKNKSGKVNRKKRTNSDATDSNATQESKSSKQKDDDKDLKNRERECRKQYEEDLKNWTEKRDDLLCDDLLPLPQVTPIDCDIPSELIGDALVIIDFLNVFHEFLAFKENTFPSHLTFDYFIKILQDNDVNARAGFADLIMAILRTIFQSNMKDAHDGNEDLKITDNNNEDFDIFNADNDEESTALQVNCFANHFVTTYFSTMEQLVRLQMDSFTVTEILRIYILKTRNFDGKRTIKICADDMALVMRLAAQTIFELNKNDRIKILKILLDDVVVQVAEIRQKIEASMDEMVKLKIRIRHLNASYTRWLRENPIRQRMRKKKSSNNDQ
ncbi:bromodomain adjacent to zinc finger domain protein 1A-like protein, partial [Euroglyphus maynei]